MCSLTSFTKKIEISAGTDLGSSRFGGRKRRLVRKPCHGRFAQLQFGPLTAAAATVMDTIEDETSHHCVPILLGPVQGRSAILRVFGSNRFITTTNAVNFGLHMRMVWMTTRDMKEEIEREKSYESNLSYNSSHLVLGNYLCVCLPLNVLYLLRPLRICWRPLQSGPVQLQCGRLPRHTRVLSSFYPKHIQRDTFKRNIERERKGAIQGWND